MKEKNTKIKDLIQVDLERYFDYLNEKKLAPRTIQRYFIDLIHLVEFIKSEGMNSFNQIQLDDLTLFNEYLDKKGFRKGSIQWITSHCRTFLKFLGLDHLFPKKIPIPYQSPFLPELKDFGNYLLFEKGCSKNTWDSYQREIKSLFNFMSDNKLTSFDQINNENFTQFLSTLYAKGLEANSVRRALAACKTFFRFLTREEVVKTNPIKCIESPKTWKKQADILTEEEIARLIEIPDVKTKQGLRDRALFELLYGSGLRITELCDLKVIDFRFPEKMVRVFGKGSKERIVPITNRTIYFLHLYWEKYRSGMGLESYAFISTRQNKPLSRVTIWKNIKKYIEKCGIKKNVHPHTFRRCFATHMLENGGELRVIQDLLGHADAATTGIYLQRSLKQVKEKFHKCHPREDVVKDDDIVMIEVV